MEQQYYTGTNAFISNGNLVILTSRVKNIFLSSRLNTMDKYTARFGKIVARIKMPEGKGMWPAFWMLGTNKSSVNWPQCGEVDIAEMRGGGPNGDQVVLGSAHWFDGQHLYVTRSKAMSGNLSLAFHDYELEWDADKLVFRIDGMEYHRVDITSSHMDAFRRPFYIILNVAIGGMFSRIYSPSGVTASFPQWTLVDWVRVYRKD
jgi:beta-glucanase (GH16 family)